MPIRVVLADDHVRARRSLRLVLDSDEGIDVIAEAGEVSTVAQQISRYQPHVVVLNLRTAGSSVEGIRVLRTAWPEMGVVVLTMEPSPAFAALALSAGAAGFVLMDRADAELPTAIRMVARGEEFVSPHLATGLEAIRRSEDQDALRLRRRRQDALGRRTIGQ